MVPVGDYSVTLDHLNLCHWPAIFPLLTAAGHLSCGTCIFFSPEEAKLAKR